MNKSFKKRLEYLEKILPDPNPDGVRYVFEVSTSSIWKEVTEKGKIVERSLISSELSSDPKIPESGNRGKSSPFNSS